eukprot:Gregarina_sp_Poly_1__3050@NODE_1858_length_3192_cov_59_492800_g1203_i0_p4_GENE_NODE_1858_length_3192_cov_59_492800_g1203_i0NODE_1858_length_3192_cov_59_492800_g1203_i0_p4_ORF_typecomplete_len117_score4_53_NODE_1858_length_3192_cov_59_492800_g1203_i087437
MAEIVWTSENVRSRWKQNSVPGATSPSTSATSTIPSQESPFVEGGIWLMPTELHLFWNLSGPPDKSTSNDTSFAATRKPQWGANPVRIIHINSTFCNSRVLCTRNLLETSLQRFVA